MWRATVIAAAALLCDVPTTARVKPLPVHVLFAAGEARFWTETAVQGASRRLRDSRCEEVLSDFADADGRTLMAVVTAMRKTPSEYVGEVWFVDGRAEGRCDGLGTAAFTRPGSRVVFVCPSASFAAPFLREYELLVIHELLHTLGLGENPPTSARITRQIMTRCSGV